MTSGSMLYLPRRVSNAVHTYVKSVSIAVLAHPGSKQSLDCRTAAILHIETRPATQLT
jgi:hypothetical protein